MFRDTNLKLTLGFTIISSIAVTTLKLVKSKERISFAILCLKVNLEIHAFLILKTTFQLTQGRMSRIAFFQN